MLQRMLIDKMENRILVGIIAFVGIMVLVGWVAINENARMASFERQFNARSIERGAELFAANCSTCHGTDGRGLTGRAPGLNSPHFFGYDFFAGVDAQIASLQSERLVLEEELNALSTEFVAEGTSEERKNEILARRQEISDRINGEEGVTAALAAAQAEKDNLINQLQTAVDNGYPIRTDLNADGEEILVIESTRLGQVDWQGTLYDYVFTTLVHGRPTSISYWDQPMVAWAQTAGGPLRDDQIGDITNYILNWDKGDDWTIADALAVNQYSRVPGLGGAAVEQQPPIGTDVAAILTRIEEQGLVGDAARGEQLYAGTERTGRNQALACSGCHLGGAVAPATTGTWDRVLNERLTLPQFAEYTPEQYLVESIVLPGEYVVTGYAAGAMPANYGEQMALQDMADILAYLETQTGG
ncbi:MAG: hypothetical protein OHK0046_32430 [Anaerolineae bacterium]